MLRPPVGVAILGFLALMAGIIPADHRSTDDRHRRVRTGRSSATVCSSTGRWRSSPASSSSPSHSPCGRPSRGPGCSPGSSRSSASSRRSSSRSRPAASPMASAPRCCRRSCCGTSTRRRSRRPSGSSPRSSVPGAGRLGRLCQGPGAKATAKDSSTRFSCRLFGHGGPQPTSRKASAIDWTTETSVGHRDGDLDGLVGNTQRVGDCSLFV